MNVLLLLLLLLLLVMLLILALLFTELRVFGEGGFKILIFGSNCGAYNTPFAVHLRKIYNHLRQQLKL